jgi:hypothetical protein
MTGPNLRTMGRLLHHPTVARNISAHSGRDAHRRQQAADKVDGARARHLGHEPWCPDRVDRAEVNQPLV